DEPAPGRPARRLRPRPGGRPDPRLAGRPGPLRGRGRVLRLGRRRGGRGVRARVRPALRAGGERLRRLLPRLGGRPRPVGACAGDRGDGGAVRWVDVADGTGAGAGGAVLTATKRAVARRVTSKPDP